MADKMARSLDLSATTLAVHYPEQHLDFPRTKEIEMLCSLATAPQRTVLVRDTLVIHLDFVSWKAYWMVLWYTTDRQRMATMRQKPVESHDFQVV